MSKLGVCRECGKAVSWRASICHECHQRLYPIGCNACCNGDRCDTRGHYDRRTCPLCGGAGWLSESRVAEVDGVVVEEDGGTRWARFAWQGEAR